MSEARVASRLDGVAISLTRQMFENAPPDAINLALGEPMFDTAETIVAAGHEALDGGRLPYTFNGGLAELREAIAEDYSRRSGVAVDAQRVLVTSDKPRRLERQTLPSRSMPAS